MGMKRTWPLIVCAVMGCATQASKPAPEVVRAPVAPQPPAAEYAVRWDTRDGGPRTAEKVLEALGVKSDEPTTSMVEFFEVGNPPADAPAGATIILRQRTRKKNVHVTFTYRGPDPIAPAPRCPLVAAKPKSKPKS